MQHSFHLLHTASLSTFFSDGFTLASSSSLPLKQQQQQQKSNVESINVEDKNRGLILAGEEEVQHASLNHMERTAGVKRLRSSVSEASTHGVTPSSERVTESLDTHQVNDIDDVNLPPVNVGDGPHVFLAPSSTSFMQMGPSGSWSSKSPLPNIPETSVAAGAITTTTTTTTTTTITDIVESDEVQISALSQTGVDRVPHTEELSSLLHTALMECYRVEDELVKKFREEHEVNEEEREKEKEKEYKIKKNAQIIGTGGVCFKPLFSEDMGSSSQQYGSFSSLVPSSSLLSSPLLSSPLLTSGNFTRMIAQIHSQKKRRRCESQRLENQMRDVTRAKELPLLIEDVVRYAQHLIGFYSKSNTISSSSSSSTSNTTGQTETMLTSQCDELTLDDQRPSTVYIPAGSPGNEVADTNQMLYAKLPPPLFQNSSFAAGVVRLLRWVRTWQRATPTSTEIAESHRNGYRNRSRKQSSTSSSNSSSRSSSTGRSNTRGRKTILGRKSRKAALNVESVLPQRRGRKRRLVEEQININHNNNHNHNNISSSDSDSERKEQVSKNAVANNIEKSNGETPLQDYTVIQRYHNDWLRAADRMISGSTATAGGNHHNQNNNNNNNNYNNNNNCGSGNGMKLINPISGASSQEPRYWKEYGLTSDHVMYDEYGNRLRSVRLAKKMAKMRAQQEEAEKAREQKRGYFARVDENTRVTRRTLFDDVLYTDSEDSSDSTEEDVTNIAVLHGPSGVGKTATVYLVAEILGYRVVEMNTSVRRCPKNIDRLLSELTRSRRLGGLVPGKAMVCIEEELKKLKSEHAAAAAAAAAAASASVSLETPTRKMNGKKNKKSNVISARAVADFFRPRVKPESSDVINVDVDSNVTEEEITATVVGGTDVEEVDEAPKRKTRNDDNDIGKVKSMEDLSSGATSTLLNGNSTQEDPNRTLLLFEDADVILGDEAMKPFYAAVRDLAQRSKVPIVVTVSSTPSSTGRSTSNTTNTTNANSNNTTTGGITTTSTSTTAASASTSASSRDIDTAHIVPMGAAQVAQFFGKRTPFTGIAPMSRSTLFAQLLVVAAAERGLLSMFDPDSCTAEEKENAALQINETLIGVTPPLTSHGSVIVKNVEEFQRIANVLRNEVYNNIQGTSCGTLNDHTDVRFWLNRLEYLLLEEQWPEHTPSTSSIPVNTTTTNNNNNNNNNNTIDINLNDDANESSSILPTRVNTEVNDTMVAVHECSHWDMRLGRVLQTLVNTDLMKFSPWEWQQFQYGEEIAAVMNSSDMLHDDVMGEARSNSSVDITLSSSSLDSPHMEMIDILRGVIPVSISQGNKTSHLDYSVHDRSTTRDRIDAFSGWWRRTRKTDATKFFVASRNAAAYEDVIGFSCLL